LTRETASSAHAGLRAHPLALLAGGVIAGFGLGTLILALLLPAPEATPLPPPPELRSPQIGEIAPSTLPGRSWAAAFGTAPEPAPPPPPPEPAFQDEPEIEENFEEEDYTPYAETNYRLRGMVIEDDGGWALVESEIGIEVVRVGSVLSGGETIVEIIADGVILQGFGPEFLLSFSDLDDFDDFDDFDDSGSAFPDENEPPWDSP